MAFWRGLKQKLSSWQSLNPTRFTFLLLLGIYAYIFLYFYFCILYLFYFYVLSCLCIYRSVLCFSFSFSFMFLLCCLRSPRVVVIIGPKNQKTTTKSDNPTKIKKIEKTFVRALR